jgi:choline dehydrogenase-like flavoprotein
VIHSLDDVRSGFERSCDAVVVGSGAAGAVAALNLAEAGLDTVVLEAGPRITRAEMNRDGPIFMARYLWEGGLRLIGGNAQIPSMQGRCLGGSTVVNSAIMYKLPDWVRRIWARDDNLDWVLDEALDRAFERVFERTRTQPTPLAVMGRRNLLARDALEAVGIGGEPLPRAVVDCEGCADCLTGCINGRKQSVDLCYLPDAVRHGAEIFTCAQVDRVETAGGTGSKVAGVSGWVVDPRGRRKLARFRVRAPRVVMAAGVLATPCILQQSGINPHRTVGSTLYAHIGGGLMAVMDEVTDPWIGATQGWGAISEDIRGMKFECLWAPSAVLAVRWGGVGEPFLRRLEEIKRATVIALVYRGRVRGRVKAHRNGLPKARLYVPRAEVGVVLRGLKLASDGLLKVGARYVFSGIPGTQDEMRTAADTEALLNPRLRARDLGMTANHVFGSCRMSTDPRRGVVDAAGRVHGVDGLTICDTSIFPSPSAVNPQATVMAMADVITRKLADLPV